MNIADAAAASMGKMVAQGLLERADALDSLCRAAFPKARPGADLRGLRTRLAWALNDSAEALCQARHRAEFDLRRALRPLFGQRADALTIIRHAHNINERQGASLLRREVVAIVGEEMHAALRFLPRAKGRRRVG